MPELEPCSRARSSAPVTPEPWVPLVPWEWEWVSWPYSGSSSQFMFSDRQLRKSLTIVALVGSNSFGRVLLAGNGIFDFVYKTRHDG